MLEPLRSEAHDHEIPRASLILPAGGLTAASIWMGGAHTPIGEPIVIESSASSWFVDCAGDMPKAYRSASARWFPAVFPDLDAVPTAMDRLITVVDEIARALQEPRGAPPEAVYVVCQHGMNRSGLVAGLVLRALGLSGEEAVRQILSARPGALSNQTFRKLLLARNP